MEKYKSNIYKLYAYKFLFSMHFFGGVLVPFFTDWGMISFTRIMILQTFFVVIVFLLEIPTGAVADLMGRKASLIFASISVFIGVSIYSSYPDFRVFLAGEFFWALGYALLSGADEALLYDTLKEAGKESDSKKIIGRFISFETAAYMVSAPIGSIIAASAGLRYTMMFMAVPFFMAILLAFTFREPKFQKKDKQKSYFTTLLSGTRYFKNHSILKILAFDKISISTMLFFIIWTYQPLLKKLNVPIIYFGFVHAAMTGIQIPVFNSFKYLEKIFGSKKRYLFWSAIVPGIALAVLGFVTFAPFAVALLLVIAAFGLSRGVLFTNYINKHIESHNRATVISTISMMERSFMAILYPLVGIITEYSLTMSIVTSGVLVILLGLISRTKESHLLD